MRRLLIVGLLVLLAAPLAAQTSAPTKPKLTDAEYLALGRKVSEWFFNGQADSILAHMDSVSRERVGGVEGIMQQRDMLAARVGTEVAVVEEKMTRRKGIPQYWRESTYDVMTAEPFVIRFLFNEEGAMVGAGMGPKSQTPAPD